MNETEFEDFKIEAILRAYYFSYFAELEKKTRKIFKDEILNIDNKIKNKLYYYYGATHSSIEYIEYDKNSTVKTERAYKEDEEFNDFSLIKIIRIDLKDKFLSKFNFNINSLNKKTISYTFHDLVKKIIEMRNVLAHEPRGFEFKEKHIIEIVSKNAIAENNKFNFGGYDFFSTNFQKSNNIAVLSNLIYMKLILESLTENSD